MRKFVSLKNALLGGASVVAVGVVMTAAVAQDQAMETVVVTGIRASLTSAQAIKQNSSQVVDSITAVDIGALPDRNIAEALQRVPGVTLQRGDTPNDLVRMGSTGQAVFVRGLSWVKSLVNGRDEFTAVAGRSLSFGDVSADLMSAVNVYKSPTASQIEGGVGGTVDLVTRKPFDQDGLVIAASGDYTYGSLIDKAVPSGNVLVSDRWQTKIGEFGALISADWQEVVNRTEGVNIDQYSCWNVVPYTGADGSTVASGSHQTATDPNYGACMALSPGQTGRVMMPKGWAWRQMEFKEQRLATNVVLQWRPTDKLEFTLFAMNTYAHNQDMEHYDYNPISSLTLNSFDSNWVWHNSGSTLTSIDTRGGSGHNRDTDISLNVKYNPTEQLDVTADVQFVESASPYRNMTFYTQQTTQTQTGLDIRNHDLPKITFQDAASNADAGNYIFPFAMDHLQYNVAHSVNARMDATYRFQEGGLFGFLKSVSAGFRTEQKLAISRSTDWNWSFIQQTWLDNDNSSVTLDGTIHCGTPPCTWHGQDGNTYTSATGGLKTAISQAELFHYQNISGNPLPALWVPKATLAEMNTLQSWKIMSAYEPQQGVQTWFTGVQDWGQWTSYAATHGCTGDDVTCLKAYDLTPGAHSAGNRQSRQAEVTYAGYVQLDYAADKFFGAEIPVDGNVGLRIVRTDDTISSGLLVMPFLQHPTCAVGSSTTLQQSTSCADWTTAAAFLGGAANQGATVARPAVSNDYMNYLPSFNMTLHWTDQLQSRVAYYETILRPDFGFTYSSAKLNFNFYDANSNQYGIFKTAPSGNGGNPYLKPMNARNYDASLEWYFSPSGSVTVSGFYKALSNYIFTTNTTTAFTNPVSGQTMNFVYGTYVNGDKGKVGGVELQYTQFYDFLPGALSGLGFQANYTKIWNSGGHNQGSDVTNTVAIASANDKSLPLEGMSPDSYNVALLYAKYGIDARVAWNWRSTYLSSSSDANNKIPVWTENYGQLDASFFYSFLDHYKIGIQATNLTGSVYHTDMGYKDFHPRTNWIEQDRKYAIILRTNW